MSCMRSSSSCFISRIIKKKSRETGSESADCLLTLVRLGCREDGAVLALDLFDIVLDFDNVLPDFLDLLEELIHPATVHVNSDIVGTIVVVALSLKGLYF